MVFHDCPDVGVSLQGVPLETAAAPPEDAEAEDFRVIGLAVVVLIFAAAELHPPRAGLVLQKRENQKRTGKSD